MYGRMMAFYNRLVSRFSNNQNNFDENMTESLNDMLEPMNVRGPILRRIVYKPKVSYKSTMLASYESGFISDEEDEKGGLSYKALSYKALS